MPTLESPKGEPPRMTCEAVHTSRDGGQTVCGKQATHVAYHEAIPFCGDCLHDCMQDASPDEQATVRKLEQA